MAIMGGVAAIASLGLGVANTIAQSDAASQAQKQLQAQQKQEQDLINQANQKQADQTAEQGLISQRNQQESMLAESGTMGQAFDANKTIYTSPLGIPTGGGKTELGV